MTNLSARERVQVVYTRALLELSHDPEVQGCVDLLRSWLDGGAPEGEPDWPARAEAAEGWARWWPYRTHGMNTERDDLYDMIQMVRSRGGPITAASWLALIWPESLAR